MMDNWRALSARLIPLQKMSVNSPRRNLAEDFRNHPSSYLRFLTFFAFASISTLFMRPDFINMS